MLAVKTSLAPMEALSVATLPTDPGWQYEPKWDGFRCLAFRDVSKVELRSKASKPLTRYFPELVQALLALKADRFVLDGEIAVAIGDRFSFDHLLMRIHPAASRIQKLSGQTPALFIVFDLLADETGKSLILKSLRERREALEQFANRYLATQQSIRLSPATTAENEAKKWLKMAGGNLDGLIAKRLDAPYTPGERGVVQKVKFLRTVDCVIGGFRYATNARVVGSLLLGLYDAEGLLHHVGFCSGLKTAERQALTKKLEALVEPPGFTGRAPGGPSRWSTTRSTEWQPLAPTLVVEVSFDQVTGNRFRHGTRFLRWRPDKSPRQCTMEQLKQKASPSLQILGKVK